ncbi:DUF1684 domain-containing protein [Haloplanus sp. GCM10025708]|uniref:DUF1684 domain-containing protein n=1 Tax=Haloferacaceae TaxID=1644056 RepID=UPI0036189BE4
MSSDWRGRILETRKERAEFFRSHPRSPIPEAERDDFRGLDYYPPDEAYRFELTLHEHDEKERVTVSTSTDDEREYLRWGEFRFTVDGEDVTLQAYKADPDDDRLWVPFRDETSGEETYGAGRYLDLEPDHHRTNDEWIVDFNRAYNPTCAYSDRYDCPLPPMENWLDVRIEAGERNYH